MNWSRDEGAKSGGILMAASDEGCCKNGLGPELRDQSLGRPLGLREASKGSSCINKWQRAHARVYVFQQFLLLLSSRRRRPLRRRVSLALRVRCSSEALPLRWGRWGDLDPKTLPVSNGKPCGASGRAATGCPPPPSTDILSCFPFAMTLA